jgi:bifunctional non-homologous end joining protein LigD
MALEVYRKKRNFKSTSEPAGTDAPAVAGNSFVIQKHDATRLHYDFRLEMDGVLKSWAVTKGPSLVPGEKRLAVHVEDHPLEYGGFEGTIPKGEYGGGTVIVWDRGTWSPIGDAAKGYAKGHLNFELNGEKLRGAWHLVRMHGKPREKHENWLLIKADDEAARSEGDADILAESPNSVKTGRDLDAVAGESPGWSSRTGKIDKPSPPEAARVKASKEADMPSFIEPALASLAAKPPAGQKWLHEIKFDGYRLQAHIEAGRVKLLTRSGLDWTKKFGSEIAKAFAALPITSAIIDGELVVEAATGASDFSALQADLSEARSDRFVFYAFDLLYLNGHDLRQAKLIERKKALLPLLHDQSGKIRYSEDFEADGDKILRHACRLSLEGVVSKLRDSPYRSGRGKNWVKSKCAARQEFVVCGFVPSTTSHTAVGSLVLGYYDGKALIQAGRVGTGFTERLAQSLFKTLNKIRSDDSPFSKKLPPEAARGVHFVRPELVAEVSFAGWTAERSLRHASFRGLRDDKPATAIVREDAPPADGAEQPDKKTKPNVTLTHPDRLYWPEAGVTKEGLASYYIEVWRLMARYIVARPLSLVRCPSGLAGECFFQKHVWQGASRNIHTIADPLDKAQAQIIYIKDLDGLIGLVQAGVLEIHPWGSSLADIEQPDTIIMDLDPAEDVPWQKVIDAAFEIRDRLAKHHMTSFVKTSGGKGLHVVAPLQPQADWATVKAFTKSIADAMAADSPDDFVAVVSKAKRHGKILVDYLRNGRGATAVAPYSTRARPSAAVSMPVHWDELTDAIGPAHFTIMNAPTRLSRLAADPWADFTKAAVPLMVEGKRAKRRRA